MNIILTIFKSIIGMKFGWVILLVVGIVFVLSFVRNIASGSFSVGKFFSGFNIFAGGVQGKLIYLAVLAILGYGLFHQLTKPTTNYDTDYKNDIHHNDDVIVDQRVGESGCAVNIGWGLIKLGCKQEAIQIPKDNKDEVINQTKKEVKPKTNIIPKKKE